MQAVTKNNLESFTEKLLQNDKEVKKELIDASEEIREEIKTHLTGSTFEKENLVYGKTKNIDTILTLDNNYKEIARTSQTHGKYKAYCVFESFEDTSGFNSVVLHAIDGISYAIKRQYGLIPNTSIKTGNNYVIFDVDTSDFTQEYALWTVTKGGSVVKDIKVKSFVLFDNSDGKLDSTTLTEVKNVCGTDTLEKYTFSNGKGNVYKEIDELSERLATKKIYMIGDSISQRIGNQITSDNFNGLTYEMKGVGGQTVLDTAAQLGAIPYMVLPCTIPASGSVNVEIVSSLFLKTEFDSSANPTWSNGYFSQYSGTGLYPYGSLECSINGVEGVLNFTRNDASTFSTVFTRKTSGSAVVLDRPYECIPTNSTDRNAIYMCFMGTNGGWDNRFFDGGTKNSATEKDADLLVNIYKQIRDYIKSANSEFLFMGFYMSAMVDQKTDHDRIAWWNYFEKEMTLEFGRKYFSVRRYLRERAYVDAGDTLTSDDIANIIAGKIAIGTQTYDTVHLNATYAKLVANAALNRLKNNGTIDGYTPITV